jgi:uncharacterized protein YchJ
MAPFNDVFFRVLHLFRSGSSADVQRTISGFLADDQRWKYIAGRLQQMNSCLMAAIY